MSHDVEQAKRALRAELRERRQLLSDAQREAAASAITEQPDALLDAHDPWRDGVVDPATRPPLRAACYFKTARRSSSPATSMSSRRRPIGR